MRYRTLGKTGLQVSALGFGASPLGGVFGEFVEEDGIRAVHAALDAGINLFDTAPFYGLTRSETVLGRALCSVPRDRYILATKVGRYGPTDFDFSADRVIRSCEESLRRLQVETIDILQCHDIEFGSVDQILTETLPALRRLQEQGKARFIGITGLPLDIYPAVLARAELDLILSYCHYTLFDTSLTALFPLFEQTGVGVINASPFAMGLLTPQGAPAWHPAAPEVKQACAHATALCEARGADIAQLALSFTLANERLDTTLVGMASESEVQRNIAWSDQPPDPDLLTEVQSLLAPIHNRTWSTGKMIRKRSPE